MSEQTTQKWLKMSLSCPETVLEPAADLVGILSGSGVDQTPVVDGKSMITGFFRLNQGRTRDQILSEVNEEIGELFKLYALTPPEPVCSFMDDEDWATSWQQFFKPFAIIPGLIIKPGWEEYDCQPGEKVIEIDPGMAFGTGQHASTRMALEFIHDCFQETPPETVLDVGTGTGILAMAAALFGAKEAAAIDNDPVAVQIATDNIADNNLSRIIKTSATDLADITGSFDLICANIIHDVLVDMASDIARLLAPGGRLVLAGILSGEQEANIIAVYQEQNITLIQASHEDEWASLLLMAAR